MTNDPNPSGTDPGAGYCGRLVLIRTGPWPLRRDRPGADHSGMTRAPLLDRDLHRAILKRLEWAPEIATEHVAVAVRDAVVTLSGEAVSPREKRAAVRTAAEVQGVAAVIDEIVVRDAVGTVDDAEIAAAVTDVLTHHPRLAGRPVDVTVDDQVVTLRGMVDSREQQLAARRAAQAVLGVRGVVDELTLPPAPTESQAQARLAEVLGGDADGAPPRWTSTSTATSPPSRATSGPGTSDGSPSARPVRCPVSPTSRTSSSSRSSRAREQRCGRPCANALCGPSGTSLWALPPAGPKALCGD